MVASQNRPGVMPRKSTSGCSSDATWAWSLAASAATNLAPSGVATGPPYAVAGLWMMASR